MARTQRLESATALSYSCHVFSSLGSHGEIGRRNGLKIRWPQGRAGSIPAESTILYQSLLIHVFFGHHREVFF